MSLVKTYPKFGKATAWQKGFSIDKVALRRRLCQESFWEFSHIFWHEVIAEDPVWNWHMRVMANELQKVAEPVFRMQPKTYDLIINVPPGSTKSTYSSIFYLPWLWTRMVQLRYIGGSFDKDLSLEFGTKARKVIRSKLYQETFPHIEISSDQDTKSHFSNTLKGERRGTSVGAGITGRHAHIIVVDDPIDPQGARSEADITTANRWMTETLPSRCVDQAVTPMILVMQRLSLNDPTGERLLRAESGEGVPVRHICLPAEVSPEVKPAIFRNKYKEGLLDPKRLPKVVLNEKRAVLGNFGYAGQFEQRPVPLSGGMFQIDKLEGPTVPPTPGKFLLVVRWWDKAASTEKWGAYTSGVLMGILKDPKAVPRYWILDVLRERFDTATRERMIKLTGQTDEVFYERKYEIGIEQEPGSGGKDSALHTVWNLPGFKVIYEKATGDKLLRADPFSVQVNAGNVGIAKGTWNMLYLEEMKYFGPMAKFRDQIDASSGAFNRLSRRRHRAGALGI